MKARFRYRLYPHPAQRFWLAKTFGCARMVFNDGLRIRQQAHQNGEPYIGDTELQKRVITQAKQTPERAWLAEVSSVALIQSLADLHQGFRNFFHSLSGKRQGAKVNPPRFKKKTDKQAIRFTRNGFKVHSQSVFIAKVGHIPIEWSRPLSSQPSSVTIIRDKAGRHFASFICEVQAEPLPENDVAIGIDVGLTTFATYSDGEKVENPRIFRKLERKLARLQRQHAKKQKGSKRRAKMRLKVAKLHAHIKDKRSDFLHKLSTPILRKNHTVVVEDLCIKGLGRTRLAKSFQDAGFGMFLSMLEAKALKYGRELLKVGRFYASSQICSACQHQDGPKPLWVRRWSCSACKAEHDRDENAAKNILAQGLRERSGPLGQRPLRAPSQLRYGAI
ncbi:RNA-guided endonuclease InsQ/TnpB family protein [Gloeobacter morelensis]|uniref:RNA-guided endonuclease InsQ/TnpB family protein n=1 Tax=Gloeobacter morelensis TaxID=2907343 RepID=UPI001E5E5150|nr:transposase [Gloeobacter morelensis]